MRERKEINVVDDQFGSPTYARDLAEAIMSIVVGQWSIVNGELPGVKRQTSNINKAHGSQLIARSLNGIYHFSNEGIISWYDFAVAIKEIKGLDCIINPVITASYPTPAKRPAYSGLDKTKIKNTFNIQLKPWKESLEDCLQLL